MFVISLFFGGGVIVLTSNDILYGVTSKFIFSADQSVFNKYNKHLIIIRLQIT